MPTKATVRKSEGVAASTPHSKRTKRAGSKRLAAALTVQSQNQSIDEEIAVSIQDDFSQKLDTMMKVMPDLTR